MDKWTRDFWLANENECRKTLMEPENWKKVPYMEHPHEVIPPGTLVRFRAMIQDMLNPQYYSASSRIYNSVTKETTIFKGKYHSNVLNPFEQEIQSIEDDLMERQIIACKPIPGLNDWAKRILYSENEIGNELEGSFNKRIRLDLECQKRMNEILIFIYPEDMESNNEFNEGLKVNSIIEIVGFIDIHSTEGDITDVKPCIHAVQLKLIPNFFENSKETNDCIWEEASNLHAELKLILTQALLGDSLAADYLLFYLISDIYNRHHDQVPGKFSLNIRGIPVNSGQNYTKKLYSLISHLVVKSKFLPFTIDTMNKEDMIPRKCYVTDRLLNRFLQLSNRTYLVVDETDLQPGNLDNRGVLNVQALKDVISNQQIQYDFTYYGIAYETQIPILTLSVGKSLLPYDIDIELTPDPSCINDDIEGITESAFAYLNSHSLLLEKLRKYIEIIATFPFQFKEDTLKVIENDYVEMRKADAKNVSPDDLHRFMTISKLIALCSGKKELNNDIWESCKALESQRKLRNK